MGATRTVDLALLEPFVAPGVFTRIDPAVEALLAPLPELHDRVLGCVEFCYTLHAGRTIDYAAGGGSGVPGADELIERRKYLRPEHHFPHQPRSRSFVPRGACSRTRRSRGLDHATLAVARVAPRLRDRCA